MKKLLVLPVFLFQIIQGNAQYKNDNVLYKTVYPEDLCNELKNQPGYLLLDVRSKGEFEDSSSMAMNIGHLKDAININVRQLGSRIGEVNGYKTKPVFVYCSHSQRSRRASKMLADSGFTNVININGGMTAIQQLPYAQPCLKELVDTKVPYNIITYEELCNKLSGDKNDIFLLDVRSDSAYMHISNDAKINAYGVLKNSNHISLVDIPSRIGSIPLNKEVILIDLFGDDAAKAAIILRNKNFPLVSILPEGIDRYIESDKTKRPCMQDHYISPINYKLISAPELRRFVESNKDFLVLDIRSKEEFSNKHENSWQNIGHIINAVNIPAGDIGKHLFSIEKYKSKPVLLYGFSSNSYVYEVANKLARNGFDNILILTGGLFSVRWTAANIKGNDSLFQLVTDVPVQNL